MSHRGVLDQFSILPQSRLSGSSSVILPTSFNEKSHVPGWMLRPGGELVKGIAFLVAHEMGC
jgi:hypothetical protein